MFNRDQIKYFAVFVMLLNHIGTAFMPETALGKAFIAAGYLCAPIMLFFLVEGYYKTGNIRRYGLRILISAAAAQYPYIVVCGTEHAAPMGLPMLNMMFTILLCLVYIYIRERTFAPYFKILLFIGFEFLSLFMDWPLYSIMLTRLWLSVYKSDKAMKVVSCVYNGERAPENRRFNQYFFYVFYPAHLWVLACIKIFLLNK